ncbi:MAG: hypothetical protein IPO90_14060 [Flavobacteriales bacterium]|nr:hypothetical protein [Flavobacteriales bacterium]
MQAEAQVSAYTFVQTAGAYSSLAAPTVLATATANSGNPNNLDDVIYPIALFPGGFSFTYNGLAYTACNVSSNGFISFGATAPGTTLYTPISGTTAYNGAVAAWGGDLSGMFNVGGITSEISYELVGVAPFRELVIQWKDMRTAFSTSTTNAFRINFQIRLQEDGNKVQIQYGPRAFAIGSTNNASTRQIGLRGATNAEFNNRTNSTLVLFIASTPGTLNSSTQAYATVTATPGMPSVGSTYTYTPPVTCTSSPSLAGGTAAATVSSGCGSVATSTLSVTGATAAAGLTYQWYSGPVGGPYTTPLGTGLTQVVTAVSTTTAYVRDIICAGGPASATSAPVTITVNPAVTAGASASPAGPFCGMAATILTGTGGLTYAWLPATGLDIANVASPTCTATTTTTYTVTATGVGGCTGTATVTVTVNANPTITSTTATPNPTCFNGNSQLQVNLPAPAAYCASTHANGCSGDDITNVTLNTLANPTTGCGGVPHYTYFNGGGAQTTSLAAGSGYTVSCSFGTDGNQYFGAWIDYNNDGTLAAGEFSVPLRMRVRAERSVWPSRWSCWRC